MTRYTIGHRDVEPVPTTGCWVWTGYATAKGYGRVGGKLAHRLFYEAAHGPIPQGKVLDHICRVRCCVNPDHLRPVTTVQNVMVNSLGVGALNAAKKCCPKCGATFNQRPRGSKVERYCQPCERLRGRRPRKNRKRRKTSHV